MHTRNSQRAKSFHQFIDQRCANSLPATAGVKVDVKMGRVGGELIGEKFVTFDSFAVKGASLVAARAGHEIAQKFAPFVAGDQYEIAMIGKIVVCPLGVESRPFLFAPIHPARIRGQEEDFPYLGLCRFRAIFCKSNDIHYDQYAQRSATFQFQNGTDHVITTTRAFLVDSLVDAFRLGI